MSGRLSGELAQNDSARFSGRPTIGALQSIRDRTLYNKGRRELKDLGRNEVQGMAAWRNALIPGEQILMRVLETVCLQPLPKIWLLNGRVSICLTAS
jgi:hypothetical protein